MTNKTTKLLQIEDNPAAARLVREFLVRDYPVQFEIVLVDRLADGLEQLDREAFDVILLDLELPDSRGFPTFEKVHPHSPGVPIIIFSSLDDDQLAIQILHAGALGYLVKGDVNASTLKRTIRYTLGWQRLKDNLSQTAQKLQNSERSFRELIDKNTDGIVIVDLLGKIRFTNPAAAALFGRSIEDLLGNPFGFPLLAGERVELDIINNVNSNPIIAEMRVVEVEWEGGKSFLASLRDISHRKPV